MAESLSDPPQPSDEDSLLFVKYGCLLNLLLTVTVFLKFFPESHGCGKLFAIDVFAVIFVLLVLGIVLNTVLRKNSKANLFTCLLALLFGLMACVSIWNLVSLYSQIGLMSISPFGWEPGTHPYILVFVPVLGIVVLAVMVGVVQKLRGKSGL